MKSIECLHLSRFARRRRELLDPRTAKVGELGDRTIGINLRVR